MRDTARQAQLPLRDRSANVKHAFALEPGRAPELRGKRVVLLDDVMTSGATLFEIARVLRSAGAANVQAWVLARTPDPAFK
ncbi:ComF family protein [Roseateles sp. GG27B]